ncbi:MAG TPA: hypothetical protein VM901_03810 [Bdellovibrionota bacterium]|jgi:hypothetical protein|nr:hypothetical protein [Bdellovibrionota bacterium]
MSPITRFADLAARWIRALACAAMLPALVLAAGDPLTLHVRAGHTTSRIAQCKVGMPIYNPARGSLRQLLEVNPEITNPDLIYVDQVIRLPSVSRHYVPSSRFLCKKDFDLPAVSEIPRSVASVKMPAVIYHPVVRRTERDRSRRMMIRIPRVERYRGEERGPASEGTIVHSDRYSRLGFTPKLNFLRLDGTDLDTEGTATVISDVNYGGELSWTHVWSTSFRTYVSGDFLRLRLRPTESGITLTPLQQSLVGFGAGLEQDMFGGYFTLGLASGAQQGLFYRATAADTIHIDKSTVLHADLLARVHLVRSTPMGFGLDFKHSWLFAGSVGSYRQSGGRGWASSLWVDHEFGNHRIKTTLEYARASYASVYSEHGRHDLTWQLGWEIALGR